MMRDTAQDEKAHAERGQVRAGQRKPTVRQVYTLARLLLDQAGERFPKNRREASATIARLSARQQSPSLSGRQLALIEQTDQAA